MKWYSITSIEYKRLRQYVAARKNHAILPLSESLQYSHQVLFTVGVSLRDRYKIAETINTDNEDDLSSKERYRLSILSSNVMGLVNKNMRAWAWEIWILGCLSNRHMYFSLLRKAMKFWRRKATAGSVEKEMLQLCCKHHHINRSSYALQKWIGNRIHRVRYYLLRSEVQHQS